VRYLIKTPHELHEWLINNCKNTELSKEYRTKSPNDFKSTKSGYSYDFVEYTAYYFSKYIKDKKYKLYFIKLNNQESNIFTHSWLCYEDDNELKVPEAYLSKEKLYVFDTESEMVNHYVNLTTSMFKPENISLYQYEPFEVFNLTNEEYIKYIEDNGKLIKSKSLLNEGLFDDWKKKKEEKKKQQEEVTKERNVSTCIEIYEQLIKWTNTPYYFTNGSDFNCISELMYYLSFKTNKVATFAQLNIKRFAKPEYYDEDNKAYYQQWKKYFGNNKVIELVSDDNPILVCNNKMYSIWFNYGETNISEYNLSDSLKSSFLDKEYYIEADKRLGYYQLSSCPKGVTPKKTNFNKFR
jgi:hypothetical protein